MPVGNGCDGDDWEAMSLVPWRMAAKTPLAICHPRHARAAQHTAPLNAAAAGSSATGPGVCRPGGANGGQHHRRGVGCAGRRWQWRRRARAGCAALLSVCGGRGAQNLCLDRRSVHGALQCRHASHSRLSSDASKDIACSPPHAGA